MTHDSFGKENGSLQVTGDICRRIYARRMTMNDP